jgi:nitrite reductase/ring-hydroxylating ferredoxin subunit
LADVADGKSRVVPFGFAGPGAELIVVRKGDDVYGYVNECRHMGISMNLLDDFAVLTNNYHIQCEYHYATYRFEDGFCVGGPCQGKSLHSVPLAVRAGRVVVAAAPAAT